MLMPPQNTPPVPPPAGQFDFMMKEQPKPPGRLSGLLATLPKPARIALTALGTLLVLVILYAVIFGGKTTNSSQLTSVMASAQEIARVSALVQLGSQNTDTKDLASTAETVLSSQEQELRSYLKTGKIKVDSKKLVAKLDKNTDKQLTAALQNNSYDQTYYNYLKTNLVAYLNDLDAASKGANKKAQAILSAANASVQTLLSAPQLK